MKKKTKIIISIVAVLLVMLVLCFTVLHPRIKASFQALSAMIDYGQLDIGDPCQPFPGSNVTDDSLVERDFGMYYNISVPINMIEKEEPGEETAVKYVSRGENGEELVVYAMNKPVDNSDDIILSGELMGDAKTYQQVYEAFDRLGYGIPDNYYTTMKCALLLEQSDFDFINYHKSIAFAYALPEREVQIFFVTDRLNENNYYYETDDKCGFIREYYEPQRDLYAYMICLFDTDDLNTYYLISMAMDDPAEAYAIINSIEFK